jgi:hypothetical protein
VPSFCLLLKALCGAQVGMNIRAYLHCVYYKVKTRIRGEKCHTLRSRHAGVCIYIVAILFLLCSLKHISLILNLKNTWQENMGYLIHFFFFLLFSGGHLSTHCFRYLKHLSIFFNIFSFHE